MSTARLERLYGSDEALGVTRCPVEDLLVLPGGKDYGRCTSCAEFVVEREGGLIVGWPEMTNPTSDLAWMMRGSKLLDVGGDGHDFALVGNRYIVDPWAKAYAGYLDRAVYDMDTEADLVRKLYGDPAAWWERTLTSKFRRWLSVRPGWTMASTTP